MAVTSKTRAKRHAHVKKTWEADMPKFNLMDYNISMIKTMTHFAQNVDEKVKKTLFIDYCKSFNLPVTGLVKLSDGYFSQVGPLAYMLQNNVALEDNHKIFMRDKYHALIEMAKSKIEKDEENPTKVVVKPNPQDAIKALASKLGAEIDGVIDQVLAGKVDFDPKEFLIANQVSSPVAKTIGTFYVPLMKELKLATGDKDYQLSEAYSHITKRHMNRFMGFVQSVIDACDTVATLAKTTRKPRKRKEKPAGVLVQKVKYLKEYPALKLRSVSPDKMVGAGEVWLFNVKYRKLFQYVAQDGMTLTVKGTTLQNFDPEKSGAKTVRKPEVFFNGIDAMTKRPLVKSFNEIRGVTAKATGRVNEDTIIVKVF